MVWPCSETRRGDAFGSTGDEEERQAKAEMDGQNQGGHEREMHTTRADAGPSCVESTRLTHRPHVKWDKTWKKCIIPAGQICTTSAI